MNKNEKHKCYYYLQLPDDYFTSKQMKKLKSYERGAFYQRILLALMLKTLNSSGRYSCDGIEDSLVEEISLDLDEASEDVQKALEVLTKLKVVYWENDHQVYIPEVEKFTGRLSYDAHLKRIQRQNAKDGQKKDNVHEMSTDSPDNVQNESANSPDNVRSMSDIHAEESAQCPIEREYSTEQSKKETVERESKQSPRSDSEPRNEEYSHYGQYGNVILTQVQLKELQKTMPKQAVDYYIDRLSTSLNDNPKRKYNSHFDKIRDFAREDHTTGKGFYAQVKNKKNSFSYDGERTYSQEENAAIELAMRNRH